MKKHSSLQRNLNQMSHNNPVTNTENSAPIKTNQTHLQAELASDLHWALTRVPMTANYYDKLDQYAAELIENYFWSKLHQYSSLEQLNLLPMGSRIITGDNCMAVKKQNGWSLLTEQGFIKMNISSEEIHLPAFSIQTANPENRHQSSDTEM